MLFWLFCPISRPSAHLPCSLPVCAAAADNAYAYRFTIERLKAGDAAGSGDAIELAATTVYRDALTLVDAGIDPRFELTIPSASLMGASRWGGVRGARA